MKRFNKRGSMLNYIYIYIYIITPLFRSASVPLFLLLSFSLSLLLSLAPSSGSGSFGFGFTSSAFAASANDSTNFSVNIQDIPKLTLVVPSSPIELNITPVDREGTFGTTSNFNVVVGTSNYSGYTLSMSALGDGSITHTTATTNKINPLPVLSSGYSESDFKSLSTTKNTWGYTIVSGHLPESSNGKYYSINNGNDTEATINASTTPVNNDATTLSFASKVDSTIPSGSYATTVTFTAITNSLPLYMQEVDTWKDTLSVNESVQALDMRDNKLYWVTKLETDPNIPELLPNTSSTDTSAGARAECTGEGADRHCYQIWMTQNLDLELTAYTRTYTHYDTDLGYTSNNTSATWTPSQTTWSGTSQQPNWGGDGNGYGKCYDEECSYKFATKYLYTSDTTSADIRYSSLSACTKAGHTEGDCLHYSTGTLYNFRLAALINATDTAIISTSNYSYAPNSICPAGWRLPVSNTSLGAVGDTPPADNSNWSDFGYLFKQNDVTPSDPLPDPETENGSSSPYGVRGKNVGYAINGLNKLRTEPLWFVRAGAIYVGGTSGFGTNPDYQTGTIASSGFAYYFGATSARINPANINYWSHGHSVRCIAR